MNYKKDFATLYQNVNCMNSVIHRAEADSSSGYALNACRRVISIVIILTVVRQ